MKTNLYCTYDVLAGVFHRPFVETNHATAIRVFDASLQEQKHYKDIELYFVGVFDDGNGVIMPESPFRVRTGLEWASQLSDEQLPGSLKVQAS